MFFTSELAPLTDIYNLIVCRFIPTLEEDTVAEAIVDGMLRNKRHLFLPSIMGFILGQLG